ncbi:hypothetical protein CL634_11520 [bacterium]|nr:hypothetical protein [bacterium]
MGHNKIMLIAAHPDDVEFGMGGTAAKLSKSYHIEELILCQGDRPGSEHVQGIRTRALSDNATQLGINRTTILTFSDVKLDQVPFLELVRIINSHVQEMTPSIVYTNHGHDIHRDHQLVSEAVRVVSRPRKESSIDELYEFSIPGSTEWGSGNCRFNVYEDITETFDIKMNCISRYYTEARTYPDPTSLDKIKARDVYHGSLCGCDKAEAFKLIFKRS